jgi:hypothetical protein
MVRDYNLLTKDFSQRVYDSSGPGFKLGPQKDILQFS